MNFIVDMNLSVRWVEFLISTGFGAEHWSSVGDPRAKDSNILNWAELNHRVVMSHDLDFGDILAASGGVSPSVVLIRSESTLPSDIGEAVTLAINTHREELEAGALMIVEPTRFRIRLLPIRD